MPTYVAMSCACKRAFGVHHSQIARSIIFVCAPLQKAATHGLILARAWENMSRSLVRHRVMRLPLSLITPFPFRLWNTSNHFGLIDIVVYCPKRLWTEWKMLQIADEMRLFIKHRRIECLLEQSSNFWSTFRARVRIMSRRITHLAANRP